jgi:hypothetical protein
MEAGAFFQKPAFNAFERLICSHLIEASKGEPLQTVIHVARAALAITDDTAKQLGIDKNQALSLYTVAQRLSTATKSTNNETETYSVLFHTLDWEKDIEPWKIPSCYSYYYNENDLHLLQVAKQPGDKRKNFFNATTWRLSARGYANMVSDFLLYAIPIVEEMSRKLATLVSPETYTELLRLYYGEKP